MTGSLAMVESPLRHPIIDLDLAAGQWVQALVVVSFKQGSARAEFRRKKARPDLSHLCGQ